MAGMVDGGPKRKKQKEITNIKELAELKQQSEAKQPEEETKQLNPDEDFQIGYMAGLQNDGKFFWRVFGKKQELVGLLGIHQFASARVEAQKDTQLTVGDGLVRELVNIIVQLNQKLDFVAGKLSEPSNKL